MPLTNLVATAEGFRTSWVLGAGASEVVAVNTDDWPATYINDGGGVRQTYLWTDLPTDARAGAILTYQVETTARRAGGIAGADFRVLLRDSVTTAEINGASHILTANAPADRFFDTFVLDPNGVAWTQPQVDAVEIGVAYLGGGTGANCYFEIGNITWAGAGGSIYVEGACWLGPLLAAIPALAGANLFHESSEALGRLDRLIGKVLFSSGIRTRPTLTLREEVERMRWDLFRRPVICIP